MTASCVAQDPLGWAGAPAVIATMHGKQRVIAPLAKRFLGTSAVPVDGLDTDRFGSFARDVQRRGSAIEAARAKIAAAAALAPGARLFFASEGSFGQHPQLPMLALDRELVLVRDRETGFELAGHAATPDTNYGFTIVSDVAAAQAFATRIGFPAHGVIVAKARDGAPVAGPDLVKDIADPAALAHAVGALVARDGAAAIETDMRAHRNPRRMRAIKRAMIDLLRRVASKCPDCGGPGFAVMRRVPGLPCRACREPTLLCRAEILQCPGCGHRAERSVSAAAAEPGFCPACNP
ncbi:MAG: hypothetical protein B7Y45_03710 [Sphingomonas sp. 28-66-16]|nr:MAG: hypothetical protein B7Y45_03710 [Sphingomonas sp. 28-66-16]